MARRPHAACPRARDEQSTTIPAPRAGLALLLELWVGEHAAPLDLRARGRLEIRIGRGLWQRSRRRRLALGLWAGRLALARGDMLRVLAQRPLHLLDLCQCLLVAVAHAQPFAHTGSVASISAGGNRHVS